MNPSDESSSSDHDTEVAVARVLEAYLERLGAGEPADPERLLAEHPEIADKLRACLEGIGLGRRARSEATTLPEDESATKLPTGESEGAPRSIGEYDLLDEIGRGGMGVVFRARHRTLGRVVALKMILAGDWASPEHQRRFRAEAEAAAALDHPAIVPIYEVGEHDGHSYFSMRLIDGGSLADRLDAFAADPRRAARVAAEIARAMHHAHQRGVLHRDLKPSNILLDADGRPHIADFGVAKRTGAGGDPTLSGVLVGTPAYMAPEQAEGRRDAITTVSDVYGLGAILYAMLTGKPPFQGDSLESVLAQVREHAPTSPSQVNRRVDADLATICRKCLEKEPRLRYATAEALAEDLERYLAGEPIQARAYGQFHRFLRWTRRRERVRQAGLVSMFLGAALLIWASSALVLVKLDWIPTARPDVLLFHVVRCILLVYIPLIVLGWATSRERSWALWGAASVSLLATITVVGHMTGFLEVDMGGLIDPKNAALLIAADAFFAVLAVLLLTFQAIALVAWWANRRH